jgi:hypothetical protein
MYLETLIEVLESSIKKNGDKPLTLSHLSNILKMVLRIEEKQAFEADMEGCRAYLDSMN